MGDKRLATTNIQGIIVKNKTNMKKMNRNEWIAVAVSIALLASLFYGGAFLGLFSTTDNTPTIMSTDTPSGVEITDVQKGTGDIAGAGDTVKVQYSGAFTDGKVFDSSYSRGVPFEFVLGVSQVIKGWDEGINGMRVGGKRHLVVSPEYGYGPADYGPIPANSTLVFDVELVGVAHPTTTPVIAE
ncbi:hypothetical protein BH11PAT3_BH11PAT3_2680 [soil metagenome]